MMSVDIETHEPIRQRLSAATQQLTSCRSGNGSSGATVLLQKCLKNFHPIAWKGEAVAKHQEFTKKL